VIAPSPLRANHTTVIHLSGLLADGLSGNQEPGRNIIAIGQRSCPVSLFIPSHGSSPRQRRSGMIRYCAGVATFHVGTILTILVQTHRPQCAAHRTAIVVGELTQLGNVPNHNM